MGGRTLQSRFRGVDWGVATADSIAAPPAGPDRAEPAVDWSAGHAGTWAGDVGALFGAAPASYRTVLGWPHIQPDGPGSWDRAALDRCDRALDGLLERGLRPGLTLLHRDLPGWLGGSDGWLERDTALRFADYAAEMARRFGDRVDRWITSTDLGAPSVAECMAGMSPSGRGLGLAGIPSVHHLLLAAGLGAQALRDTGVTGEIGTTVGLVGGYPATDDPWDRIAVERLECWGNRLFLDPMLLGEHMAAEDGYSPIEESGCVRPGDLAVISAPQDVLALSWHLPILVTAPENLPRVLPVLGCFQALNDVNRLLVKLGFAVVPFDHVEATSNGWPIIPEGLADALGSLHEVYGDRLPPLHLIDNGMSDPDDVKEGDESDEVGRARRRALLSAKLSWLAGVMEYGVRVRGYEYWSVLDNLGWKLDYSRLYGVSVPQGDPPRQPPIPRDWATAGALAERRRAAAGRSLTAIGGRGAAP